MSADLSQCANPNWDYCFPAGGDFHFCVIESFNELPQGLGVIPYPVHEVDPTLKCGSMENLLPPPQSAEEEFRRNFVLNHFHLCTNSTKEEIHLGPKAVVKIHQNLTCPSSQGNLDDSQGNLDDFWDSPLHLDN